MRVLIFGGGIAAQRYVESLMFDSDMDLTLVSFGIEHKTHSLCWRYGLRELPYADITGPEICNFHSAIVCVPLSAKFAVTERIVDLGYKGALLLEKPLCITVEEYRNYQRLLWGFGKCRVAYARDYLETNVRWIRDGASAIEWSSVFDDLEENIVHNLPHLLNWMMRAGFKDIRLQVAGSHELRGHIDSYPLKIIFERTEIPRSTINGEAVSGVDYRKLDHAMVKSSINITQAESRQSLEQSRHIAEIIENIRRNRNGYYGHELHI